MNRSTLARSLFQTGTAGACAGAFVLIAALILAAASPLRADPVAPKLLRVAEILGSVHHLREICGANEGALWRNKMIDLLEITHATGKERETLIARFNAGFYRASRNYPVCTGRAIRESNALLNEGQQVAAAIAADATLFSGGPQVP